MLRLIAQMCVLFTIPVPRYPVLAHRDLPGLQLFRCRSYALFLTVERVPTSFVDTPAKHHASSLGVSELVH